MSRRHLILLMIALTVLSSMSAFADSSEAGSDSSKCYWGKPLPHCSFFFVTEFGIMIEFHEFSNTDPEPQRAENPFGYSSSEDEQTAGGFFELGFINNVSRKFGFGGTVYFVGHDNARFGLKVRGRHWLNERTALDIGAGRTWRVFDDDVRGLGGYASSVSVSIGDKLIFGLQWDVFKVDRHRFVQVDGESREEVDIFEKSALYGSISAGSRTGLIIAVVYSIVAIVYGAND